MKPLPSTPPWHAPPRALLPGLALFLLLLLAPLAIRTLLPAFYLSLLTEMLIMGIFASGYNVLLGFTGRISFGHAAFFGLGAYATGLLLVHGNVGVVPAVLVALVLVAAVAAFVGYFSIRLKWVYFALLTFAFAQVFYQAAGVWTDVTGGFDGLALSVPMSVVIGPLDLDLRDRTVFYYVVVALLAIVYATIRLLVASPFGRALVAIRENEVRASALGYNVAAYTRAAFIISAVVAGIAGALFVPYQRFLSPELLSWHLSGLVIIMVLLGGVGTLAGPVVGAGVVIFLRDFLSAYTEHYFLILGSVFILVVLFAPGGLATVSQPTRARMEDAIRRRTPRSHRRPREAADER